MIFKTVADLLAERLDVDASTIREEDTFRNLGIDSLDMVDLLMELEDELGISIELDEKIETVGELVRFIEGKKG